MEKSIGKKIQLLRKETALTQKQLAERLGTTRECISSYESGKNTPPIEVLILISQEFQVSVDFLLNITKHRAVDSHRGVKLSPEELELVSCYQELSPYLKEKMQKILEALRD